MSKPYREVDFSDQIAQDRGWRLKEISDLKSAILRADQSLQTVLLRALVAICYAHWEGYVRYSARKYLEHIALRKLRYSQLDRQFLRNYFLPRLSALASSKLSVTERCALVDEILNSSDRRFSKMNEDLVSTRSNLNFDIFADICLVCGVPIEPFSDQETFIDVVLLKRRNAIAHGEDTFVGVEDLDTLANQTVGLMRSFADALENRIYMGGYKAA
ncbi:MAG: MAE_28990/MAE_18760 family HEPN-like nuclease [Methylocystis sp.]